LRFHSLLPRHKRGTILEEGDGGRGDPRDVFGYAFTIAYSINFKFVRPGANKAEYWLWSIGSIGMVINFVIMFVVSKLTKESPMEVQNMVASLWYPREVKEEDVHAETSPETGHLGIYGTPWRTCRDAPIMHAVLTRWRDGFVMDNYALQIDRYH